MSVAVPPSLPLLPLRPFRQTGQPQQPFGSLLRIGVPIDSPGGAYPIRGMVADALLTAPVLRLLVDWVGVRRVGFASVLGMFADGHEVGRSETCLRQTRFEGSLTT